MDAILKKFYQSLLVLSAVFMVGTFLVVGTSIVSRLMEQSIPGLDAYAGYCIAAALFLALPATLQQGDHIRVTLVIERLPKKFRHWIEWWCLGVAGLLSVYMAWFSVRFVYQSYTLGDVSTSADATPLWIPQLAMALGCIGFAIAFLHALVLRWKAQDFIQASQENAHVE